MIDKNELIAALDGRIIGGHLHNGGYIHVPLEEAEQIYYLLTKQSEVVMTLPQWISVNDRLPEVGKVVLAFGTRSATTGMFQGVCKRNDRWWWKKHTIKHVSHWMPLPEPPEVLKHD